MTKKELDVLMPREMANKILKMYEWQQEVVKWFDVAPSAYIFLGKYGINGQSRRD